MIRIRLLALIAVASPAPFLAAQEPLPEDRGAAGLWRALLELQTTATVLHVVAHPDDEDAGLLTLLARGRGVRTIVLSLTRGEGGANVVSGDFFDALGILRTLEFSEACRHYGAELFFTRAADYGYSKSLEEAEAKWPMEEVLRDAVRVVRRERPDVIVSRFRGDRRDGHGQHQYAGRIAHEVFTAAADPARFPELAEEGLRPWQARKLYRGGGRPRPGAGGPEPGTLTIETGEHDPILGRSYHQIGREGYSRHRSQGMAGPPALAGPRQSHYVLVRATDPSYRPSSERSLLDGIDPWIPGLEPVRDAAALAIARFDPREPESLVEPLSAGLEAARQLLESVRGSEEAAALAAFHLRRKERELEEALALALGIDFEAVAEASPHGVPGQSHEVRARLVNRGRVAMTVSRIETSTGSVSVDSRRLESGQDLSVRLELRPASPTRAWGSRGSLAEPLYTVGVPRHRGLAFPPPEECSAALEVAGTAFTVRAPVRAALDDARSGASRPLFHVVPAISVSFSREAGIVPLGARDHAVSVTVRASPAPRDGVLRLELPEGWRSEPTERPFRIERAGEEATFGFTIAPPAGLGAGVHGIRAVAASGGAAYAEGFEWIGASGAGRFPFYRPAAYRLRAADVKVAGGLRLAYIMGSGDDVPAALELLGARPQLLGPAEVEEGDLSRHDAVIIGVRAYAVRPELEKHNRRLLDYVERGGVLIVQYQTPEFDGNFGPYPYSMGSSPEEVSEEDAAVSILEPGHTLFTAPNAITAADFDGWVEQRGSKFWATWDAAYTPLLECHDRGQEPQRGGMLFARHGKGAYVYTAYAWYRQLPHGVPGAFRIYANMISLARTLRS
jgi:LmbE family N-acetylglucosaminyl deacetylase